MTKEEILAAIRREAAANGDRPLSLVRFTEATGIQRQAWNGLYWARWNDAVNEAGYQGHSWGNDSPVGELSSEDLLATLAELVREFGRFPTGPELQLRKRSDQSQPHPAVFRDRFGNVDEQRARVYTWAKAHTGWEDVAEMLRPLVTSAAEHDALPNPPEVTGHVYLIKSGDFYKVGRSNSVGRRTYEVSLQLPQPAAMLHSIETDDPAGIEAYWHTRFAASRTNGEWFKLSAKDVEAFKRRQYQ